MEDIIHCIDITHIYLFTRVSFISGLPSIVAALLGAKEVLVNERESEEGLLDILTKNFCANGVSRICKLVSW